MAKETKSAEKPTVMLVVKNQPDEPASEELKALALQGWNLAEAKSVADAELKGINDKLHDLVEPGTALLCEGKFRASVTEAISGSIENTKPVKDLLGADFNKLVFRQDEYSIKDAKALKKALGAAEFRKLVDVKTTYLATPEFLECASDRSKLGKALRPLITLKLKKSVRWAAQKPKAGTVSVKAAAIALVLGAGLFLSSMGPLDAHPAGSLRTAFELLSSVEFDELPTTQDVNASAISSEPSINCTPIIVIDVDGNVFERWDCYGVPDGDVDG